MRPKSSLFTALLCRSVSQTTVGSSHWTKRGGLLLGVAIAPIILVAPADAAELTQWSFDPETRQLEVRVPGGTTPNYFLLAQPARIVLDLPNTVVGNVVEERRYSGMVRHIRVGQFQPGLTRIVIELSSEAVLAPAQVELRNVGSTGNGRSEQWVLRPLLAGDAPVAAIEPVPSTLAPEGIDEPAEVEPEGVVFEPSDNTDASEEGAIASQNAFEESEATDSSELTNTSEVPEADEAPETDTQQETEISEFDLARETAELPPLEPGAFEIPVVIPPPELNDSELSNPNADSDSERNELNADGSNVAEAQSSREDSEINLPVAIAPSEAVEEAASVTESSAASANTGASNVERAPSPNLDSQNANRQEESDDLSTEVASSEDSVADSNAVTAHSTNSSTRRVQVTSPEDLQRVLDEITSGNTAAPSVQSTPTEPERDDTEAPIGIGEGGEESQEEPESSPSSDAMELDSSEEENEAIATGVELFVPDASGNDPQASSETISPSPEDEIATAAAPAIDPEALQDLPPAIDDIDESVTVTVPALDEFEVEELSAVQSVGQTEAESDITEVNAPEDNDAEADVIVVDDIVVDDIEADEIEVSTADIEVEASREAPSSNTLPSSVSSDSAAALPSPSIARPQPVENATEPEPDFSQELPIQSPAQGDRQLVVAARSGAQIPSGTVLTLRYPRLTSTLLQTGIAWQDVLLLEQTIRDTTGQVIAPEGSQIIGRFEITDRQIRFVTQAIALDGRTVPLQAVSGWVAIGTNTDAVLIRPNQIVNVRLAENFSR